jgi:hypothetical protein
MSVGVFPIDLDIKIYCSYFPHARGVFHDYPPSRGVSHPIVFLYLQSAAKG